MFSVKRLPSACNTSDGCSRSNSAASCAGLVSHSQNCPAARLSQASPSLPCATCTASNQLSRFSSSSAESVSVPGVTIRTTLRSTGPLLVAGSPICSQIATDSPNFTNRAKYDSTA